ncbi:VCBS domain-containing protein [Vibrio tapetis]|uniref:VCBS domain-containing protein n=1 Tax=Vibrio tapetis TaxID=52443 RepID=UPI00155928DC|nr:VCBS domain-containing protein [Vibrio tapetis]
MIKKTELALKTVVVIGLDGNIKVLEQGEILYPGEVIVETLADQTFVGAEVVQDEGSTNISSDIAAIIDALQSGEDPTQLGEEFASAAGAESGSSLTTSGTIERTGAEVLASTFFETSGFPVAQQSALFDLFRGEITNTEIGATPAIVKPSINGGDQGKVVEDEILLTGGKLDVIDRNPNEAVFNTQTDVADGNYGSFSIDRNGNWTYQLNNDHVDIQSLNSDSDPIVRTITVSSVDGTTHDVTVTITGTDDKAELTPSSPNDDAGAVQEDVTLTTSGNLNVVDPDAGEAVFITQTNVTDGNYGSFSINETGEWTYTLNNTHADVQALDADSKPIVRTITVSSADGTTHDVTVTITGTDDKAVITPNSPADDAGAVQEDVTLTTSGNLNVVDPDAGEAVFVEQTNVADGNYGSFSIDETGEWTYTLNNTHADVQALDADSKPIVRTITVSSADGTTHDVTVTITGTDDKAVITPNTPTDDAGAVREDVTLTTSGNLNVVDPDAGEAVFVEQTNVADGNYGSFSIDETGEWTYTLNNTHADVQALDTDSKPIVRTITVSSADGTTHDVTVTITGTDDKAVITPNSSTDDAGAVQEDVTLTTSGNLNVVDPDAGEAVFITQTNVADGNYGSFSIDETGEWTYTLNNDHADVQALDVDSKPIVRTITVSSADGTTHDVTVTITGTDDKAVITPNSPTDDAGAVQEDVTLTTSGNLNVVDPDAGEAVFITQTNVVDGNYGTFSIDETGEWTYTLNNTHADVQALDADSKPIVRIITVSSADGTTHDVTVTITGTDDKAVITPNSPADDAGAVQEDVTLTTSGNLNVVDPDAGEAVFITQTNVADGNYGSFSIDETGEWTYTLNNAHADVQALDADSKPIVRTITVLSADGTTHEVKVTITGTDDKAVITPNTPTDDAGAVQEDVTLTTSGNLNVVDPDAGEAVFITQTNVADGNYGSFSIDETGEWTYTLNNTHADVQALDADSKPIVRTITVSSADGTTHDVTVTITGTDDKAVITPNSSTDDAGAVQEDVTLTTSGNLNVVDPDAGEAVFVEQTNVSDGNYGSFSIDETGEWTYKLNNTHADVQALDADSKPIVRTITVSSADGTTHDVTVTITGTDDKAVITPNSSTDDAGAVQEDVTLTTSGNLNVVDPDAGEAVFITQTNVADGNYGSFSIDDTGEWTYTLNNTHADVQALDADSKPIVRTITVSSADGTTHEVKVTITGTDDKAVITPNSPTDDAGAVQEDVTLTTSGNLNVVDPDAGEAVFITQTNVADGNYGSFSIDETGEWTYTLNNTHADVQALDADSKPIIRTITVASADGTTHEVTVTITGTDDKAVITPNSPTDDSGAVQEDVTLTTSGNLNVVDPDAGEAVFITQTNVADGNYGTFSIDETGEWTYTLNNAHADVQALDADSKPIVRTITVSSADGTTHEVKVTITGTDDKAVITPNTPADDAGAVQEDVTLTTSGNLNVVDPDAGEAVFVEQTNVADGNYGSFSIDETGEWIYTLNNTHADVQALDADSKPIVRTITVSSADGTTHDVTVTITGTDDKAVITPSSPNDDAGAVQEDVTLTTSGNLNVVDPDAGEAVFIEQTNVADGNYGSFSIDETGEWTYTLNNTHADVQALDADSKPIVRTITVSSADGTTHDVTVTITGTDDKAVITPNTPADDAGAVQEDVTLTTSGNLNVVDPDAGEAVFITQTNVADGNYGSFSIDETGEWTYTLNNTHADVQALDADSKPIVRTITVSSADGSTHDVTVTITGTDDKAVITPNTPADDAGAVQEDVTLTTSGNLNVVDPDAGEAVFITQTNVADGNYGSFSIDDTGEWTYTLNNAHADVQALDADSKPIVRTITVSSADGTTHDVTVTITGTDDKAVITPNSPTDDAGAVQEDVTLTTSGNLNVVDPDAGEAVFITQTNVADGNYGSFSIDETGEWTYTLNNTHADVQALDADSKPIVRTITVSSADGTTHEVTVTITGTDDKAVITPNTPADDAGAVQEDVTLTTSGNLNVVDPDAGEAVFITQTNVADGNYGSFSIDETGEWTYKLNNNHADVQALDADSKPIVRTITVSSADGTTHEVKVTIKGSDDKPEFISGANDAKGLNAQGQADADTYQFEVNENSAGAEVGTVKAFDNDNGDTLSYVLTNHTDLFEIDSVSGVVSLKSGVSLDHESTPSYQLDVEVVDSDGLKDTAKVDVVVKDINEAPIAVDDQGLTTETKTLDASNWDSHKDIQVSYYVIDTKTGAKTADATKADYDGDGGTSKFGVNSGLDTGTDQVKNKQIGYDDATEQSEAVRFSFAEGQLANHAEVELKNLWTDTKHGSWEPGIERGTWKAYYQGEVIASGVFEGTGSGSPMVVVDANGRYFDSIEMSALSYKDGVVDPKGSEYFITEVKANLTSFDDAYHTHGTGTLALDVLANDSDPENDKITIVDYPKDGYLTLQDGKLVFDSEKYLNTLPVDQRDIQAGAVRHVKFDYTIQDEHGLQDTASVTVTIIGEAISLDDSQVTLSESDLSTGQPVQAEGDLSADIGSASDATYQFGENQTLSGITSEGKAVQFEVSSDKATLTGFVGQGADRVEVLKATLNSDTGHYKVEQSAPIDHPDQGADTLTLPVNIAVNVGTQTDTATLNLNVIDSVPTANNQHHVINDVEPQNNSLIIALDASGSMKDVVKNADGQDVTRWDLARNAIKDMFEKYDDLGDVKLKIATHSGYPSGKVSGWIESVDDIDTFFDSVRPAGWTPYSQAINQVNDVLNEQESQDEIAGTTSQLYFISDGSPSDFNNWTNQTDQFYIKARTDLMKNMQADDFDSDQRYQDLLNGRVTPTKAEEQLILEQAMESGITANGHAFNNIWSIGIGAGASLEYLTPIATDKGSAIVVEDDANIGDVLAKTISGQLQSTISPSHQGEVEQVRSISVGDDVYHFDKDSGHVLKTDQFGIQHQFEEGSLAKLPTEHGFLTINFENGWYDYKASNVSGHQKETFKVIVVDSDGDTANSEIVIDIRDRAPEIISPTDSDQVHGTDATGAPTDDQISFNVNEKETGILVGKIDAYDPDGNDTVSYKIVSGDENKFEINQRTGEIWLRDGEELDYDAQKQYQLTVEASDGQDTDTTNVTLNTVENSAPTTAPVQGFAEVEDQPINKLTVVFDFSSSMTRTFDGSNTVRGNSNPDEILAPREESRAYKAAEALHDMVEKLIAEGGNSNTYVRLVKFAGEAEVAGWYELKDLEYMTRPPELAGLDPASMDYKSKVNSYVNDWCWVDSRGLNTDYSEALDTVMGKMDNPSFPWQDGLDENGKFDWDLHLNEQPVESKDTVFFISDGAPNPKDGTPPTDALYQRWAEYVKANDAKVYGIGIASSDDAKVAEAMDKLSHEVIYADSGENLGQYLNHISPTPIAGELLAGASDVDGDSLTILLNDGDFALLNAEGTGVDANHELVTQAGMLEGSYQIETAFGTLAIESNGSYRFTQDKDFSLNDGEQTHLNFSFKVSDGKGGVTDNLFTLTLTGEGSEKVNSDSRHHVMGDDDNNSLLGTDGADVLFGQGGEDSLHGGTGNDILIGGDANDILNGGLGDDILTGGSGQDVFVFDRASLSDSESTDVITDFKFGQDKLDVSDILSNDASKSPMDNLLAHVEATYDGDDQIAIKITSDSGQIDNIEMNNLDLSGLDISATSSSHDIVDQLFQQQAFKVD